MLLLGLVDPTLFRITDMSHVTGDNLIMHVRKKLRQKYGYPKGSNMQGNKKPDKKWNIATVHTLPTGSRRGKVRTHPLTH
jgi:tRNA A37 threonylcarbamoyladenosine dehydratase